MALKKLTLPCYFETEETVQHENMHSNAVDIGLYAVKDATIYEKPYFICPHTDSNGRIFGTRVYFNDYCISTLSCDEIDILIEATWGE